MPPVVVDMPSGTPPAWVGFIVDRTGPATLERGLDDMRLRAWSTNDAVFVEAIAPRVDDVRLRRGVAAMYRQVFKMLDAASMPHLWRCWHYLPDIHRDVASGQNRYMHFNAGRHAAYVARYGSEELGAGLPAASAVGHDGTDLVCHVLAGRTPGVAIENPRQTPAYRYSARYGPLPPCFARGTIIERAGKSTLLLAGTASILGEETHHVGDLAAQLHELCINLTVLCNAPTPAPGNTPRRTPGAAPARLVDLRAYVRHPRDAEAVTAALATTFPYVHRIECVSAQICRPELLVEVEGIATLT